ncbi:MAG: hypothetical protein ACU841_03545 [Gammaproteobacteria bacterium]
MPVTTRQFILKVASPTVCSVASLYLLSSQAVAADENKWLPDSVQIHGFLSQGFIHTSDNNFFGKSDDSISHDFRELGLNGSWKILTDLQVAMQVVWRDAGDTDNGGFRIDYGLANYNLYSSESSLLSIRAGRVPTPLGFYNDTRDVAATRPTILLPQSIYFDINRNLALSADGGYLYGEHRTDYGEFTLNIGMVNPRMDDPDFIFQILATPFGGVQSPGTMEGNTSWVARLGYELERDIGDIRLAVTYGDFRGNYHPIAGAFVQSGSFQLQPLILSAQYNAEKWSLTWEYALRRVDLNNFVPSPDVGFTGQSYYVQGTYKLTDDLEAVVRYDDLIWDVNDPHGHILSEATGGFIPAHSRFAQDWTFGLRYEIFPSLMLSAEYHRINGTGWLSPLENNNFIGATQHWDLYTTMISYNF